MYNTILHLEILQKLQTTLGKNGNVLVIIMALT